MRLTLKLTFCILLLSGFIVAAQQKIQGTAFSNGKFVSQFIGDNFTLINNDTYGIYNLAGKSLITGIETPIVLFSTLPLNIYNQTYFEKTKEGISLKGLDGKSKNPAVFSHVIPFITENTAVLKNITTTSKKVMYIDTDGKEIIAVDWSNFAKTLGIDKSDLSASDMFNVGLLMFSPKNFQPYNEGLTAIFNPANKMFGFVDTQFNLVIKPFYAQVTPFFEGFAAVMDEHKNWGYIDKTGTIVIPFTYSQKTGRFNSGLARVLTKSGKYGFIDNSNNLVIKPQYDHATDFYKGFALVRENDNSPVCLIDSKGAILSKFDSKYAYFDSSASSENYGKDPNPFFNPESLTQLVDFKKAVFSDGRLFGILDQNGEVILPFEYNQLKDYHDGKMLAHHSAFIDGKTQNRYGIIDEQGNFLLEFVESEF